MSMKDIALARAIGMLKGAGVAYVILAEGETTYASDNTSYIVRSGDRLAQSLIPPHKQRATMKAPRRDWKWTGYVQALSKLQAGESWTYDAVSIEEAKALQKAVSSFSHTAWGSGNSMTSVTGNKLEVLRLV